MLLKDEDPVLKLIKQLNGAEQSGYDEILKSTDINPDWLMKYGHWEEASYTRICLERTRKFELLLLCWEPNSETPIHGHDGQQCWVKQVLGDVEEVLYSCTDSAPCPESRAILEPGDLTYMSKTSGYHMLRNKCRHRAMTLHLYVKPINHCEVFDFESSSFEEREMVYDQHIGLLD